LKGGLVHSLQFTALASLALLGGCAARSGTSLPAPDAAGADPYARCWIADPGPADDPTRCLRGVEARLVAEAAGRARRSGSRLELRAADTVIAEFADQSGEGEEFVRYRYGGWLARVAQHVVLVDLYEGAGVVAVDGRTGRVAELLGRPELSPDGGRVAAANVDLVAAYTESGLQVWRVTPEGLELEWALDGGGRWGGSAPRWLAPDRLAFTFHTLEPSTMELRDRPATLELRPDGFTVRLGR
jgi:hypothetical protein